MAAWTAFQTGTFAHAVLIVVFVFSTGSPAVVGAVAVLRVLPGGLAAPLTAMLAASRHPQRHLAAGIGVRAAAMAATAAAVLCHAPVGAMLALVTADSLLSAAVRPLHGALVVRLARSAGEAATANAATSSLLSASTLAGPALAGVALQLSGIGWAFALPAVLFTAGTVAALLIGVSRGDQHAPATARMRAGAGSHWRAIGAGFAAIRASAPATAATAVFVTNVTVVGLWYVASAAVAEDRLKLGGAGVTVIMAVYGGGGLLGALLVVSGAGRRRPARVMAAAMAGWAVTLVAIGAVLNPVVGLILAAGAGAAAAVTYAVGPTLVQRSVARDAMAPATAGLQSLYLAGIAAGATIAPVLIGWAGVSVALLITGAAVAIITVLCWPQLRRADRLTSGDAAKLAAIAATPILAALPLLAREHLARAATRQAVPADADVVRQGERGERFYLIAAGLADVTVDGHKVATLGPGGSFGEIALLHDRPRSATVTARTDLDLISLDRAEFYSTLAPHTDAATRLHVLAGTRLSTPPVDARFVQLDPRRALDGRSAVDLLTAQAPLAATSARHLRELADAAQILAAPDGTVITREGDHADTYYIVLRGAAEVLQGHILINNLRPGQGFADQSILRDIPHRATVRAVGRTELLAVHRAAFQRAHRGG